MGWNIRVSRKKAKAKPKPKNYLSEVRLRFEAQGWRPVSDAEIAEAEELFRRIRAARRAGSDLPYHSKAEFASGIYALEMRDAYLKCHTHQAVHGSGVGWAKAYGPIRQKQFHGIAHDEWEGFHIEGPHPAEAEVSTEDRELCARILAKSPGRPVGRPPIGVRAMTDLQRKRRQLERRRLEEAHALLYRQQKQLGTDHYREAA